MNINYIEGVYLLWLKISGNSEVLLKKLAKLVVNKDHYEELVFTTYLAKNTKSGSP